MGRVPIVFFDDMSQHVQLLQFGVMLCQMYMHRFWMSGRLPIGSKYTARLENQGLCLWCICWARVVQAPFRSFSVDVVFALGRSRSFEQFR